ncbi:putative glycosyltransferase EpsE [termite gut metagenome]|uniref:Putative glycosyltransferase EpsE n=1 Tax=termite gut metagenome TaxID=433724 RepID=A0A5J4SR38_9ZZZZ
MIPKIIHYCWFGKEPLPGKMQRCIASWRKFCPDYEIILWNEENFDLSISNFAREAYESGKLAFVSDFIRIYLLYTYGGIYLDTDVEVLRPLDDLLNNEAFSALENPDYGWIGMGTAVLGAKAGSRWVKEILHYYENSHFIHPDGSLNMDIYIHGHITGQMYGVFHADTHDYGEVKIYEKQLVYPHNALHITADSYTIHHCTGSWVTPVSVVMPAYNAAKTIAEAIRSVLDQTCTRFELLVIDDGSTDNTADVVRSFKDNRVVLIRNEHDYIGSLNLGLRRSSGKYIARMDADDVMFPKRLQLQYETMETHTEVAVCGTWMRRWEQGRNIEYQVEYGSGLLDNPFSFLKGGNSLLPHTTAFIRKNFLTENHLQYDKNYTYAEDYKLWFDIAALGGQFYIIPQSLLHCRYLTTGASYTHAREQEEATERIRKEIAAHLSPSLLTIIIPFLNEGEELERTLKSIRQTATGSPDIILINDAGTDGYDYKKTAVSYGCRCIRHTERTGVAASRDEGVRECNTPYFLLLDAHMEFYEKGWDERIIRLLQENSHSLLCSQTRVLWETRDNCDTAQSPVFGACFDQENSIQCSWNHQDPDPGKPLSVIECIRGGAYACSKAYWQHLHGLEGLVHYGFDEELISRKVYEGGGTCLLVKDWTVGHVYRQKFPYNVENKDLVYNQLLIIEFFFEGERKQDLVQSLQNTYGDTFNRAEQMIKANYKWIEKEKAYLKSIKKR